MADLLVMIQTIMKCQKETKKIDVTLKDAKTCSGFIRNFSGKMLLLDEVEIDIRDIKSVEEHQDVDLSPFLMSRVLMITDSQKNIDAVLVSADGETIRFVTENGQETIRLSDIVCISCDGQEIVFRPESTSKEAARPDSTEVESVLTENKADTDVPDMAQAAGSGAEQEISVQVEETSEADRPYEPNAFERALIDGNRSVVARFISRDDSLAELGYSETEIGRIRKMYPTVTWGTDLLRTASRIYFIQMNKHGLARKYYEMALEQNPKGSVEYLKALNSLMRIVIEDGDEKYMLFWKKHATYLKENPVYCKWYMEAALRRKNIRLSEFERFLIQGDKASVKELLEQETGMFAYGYHEEELERIRKAFKVANWEVTWYRTAVRIYAMQLNRKRLAEVYYEAALVIANKKGDEYPKILNALAMIKMKESNEAYILFFKTYREKLKKNSNYCTAYANALVSSQNWKQLEKDLPMLKEQLSDNPSYLEQLEEELEYYGSIPPFVLEEMEPVYRRYITAGEENEREKYLIDKLPDRDSLKELMELYFLQKEEMAYFALAEYALFFIREDKMFMQKLRSMLKTARNDEMIIRILPKVPVLWCDHELIRKYVSLQESTLIFADDRPERQRLQRHIAAVGVYQSLNAFEVSMVSGDQDEVMRYLDHPYLLEELGYSDDEIEEMSVVDVEGQFSSDVYTMRRILAFQGNRKHTAEQYLFEAFYDNKIDMCNRLFPLLLEEKRGDLILELFAFDDNLNSRMASLQRFYYIALCYAETDDTLFFEELKSKWMRFPEDEIIDRMLRIARNREDGLLVKQLEAQKNKPRGNEFETALIEADSEGIRKFVKNANLLVEFGYTPEEIQKISKIFLSNVTNNGMKPGQIANRVYLYQKNKNSLAERLYWNAIGEDTPEDVLTDYKALFQIYTGQHHYEMVCKIYEDHLHKEMQDKFNRTYASTYCVALYELNRFEDFIAYFKNHKDRWESFPLSANLLYVCEVLNVHEYDAYIWEHLGTTTNRPDIIVDYMLYVIRNDSAVLYTSRFTDLFNMFFMNFSTESLEEIAAALQTVSVERFELPRAAVLVAMADPANQSRYISDWLAYMLSEPDAGRETDMLFKLAVMFKKTGGLLAERAISLYVSLQNSEANGSRVAALEEFIYENLTDSEQRRTWCGIQEKYLTEGKGTIHSLKNYLEDIQLLNQPDRFWEVYLEYKKTVGKASQAQELFDIVWKYLHTGQAELNDNIRREALDELINFSKEINLDDATCRSLAELCSACGRDFEGQIFSGISRNTMPQMGEGYSVDGERTEGKSVRYLEHLKQILNDYENAEFSGKLRGWSRYVVLSEDERMVIERLRNTIKTAELWMAEEVNILAKAIFCEPSDTVYWKLLQTWMEKSGNTNEAVTGGILFQLSSQGNKETEYALNYAIANNLRKIALDLTLRMLDSHMADFNISAQKNIRSMIKKGWFGETQFMEKVPDIIRKIGVNIRLAESADYVWNSVCAASDLTIDSGEYGIFLDVFRDYLSKECAKQCCVIIAAMILSGHRKYVQEAFDCLKNSFSDVPYKALVTDLYEISCSRMLSEAERMVLECIQMDHGNALGVNNLLGFYCDMCRQDKRQCGLETVKILMKYTRYDPVLFEVAACFLKDEKDLENQLQFYHYMYDYLNLIQSDSPISYAAGQMVCGENYLRMMGKEVPSFKKMIEERYPRFLDVVKNYQEFCDCVIVGLRTTEREEFAGILFAAIFTGNWTEVFEYRPTDLTVKTVLKNNIKTDRINVADDYYRSVIKSVALFVLKHNDMWEILDASDRIQLLWSNIGNAGCDFEYFSKLLQYIDEEYIPELYKIWTLDLETLTVYKKFFGRFILEQQHCDAYAHIFSVFTNARSGDIFSNIETQEFLKGLDKERAIKICSSYEPLYLKPSGPTNLFGTEKSVIKDSDYENNIFSNYLKRNTDDFTDIEKRYARFRKKYELICGINSISSYRDANSPRFHLNTKRQIFSLRSLHYYYSVLSGHMEEGLFENHHQAEFINAVTIVLSDDSYLNDLDAFLAKFGSVERMVLGILILSEQEMLDDAVQTAVERLEGKWKACVCARLVASYGRNGRQNEKCVLCLNVAKSGQIENYYWIKNYKHCKSIEKLNPALYLSDMAFSGVPEKEEAGKEEEQEKPQEISKIVCQEMVSGSEPMMENEEMTADVPVFIRDFLNVSYEEKELEKLQEQWRKKKDLIDNGGEIQDTLNELSINIGIMLIRRDSSHFEEKIMNEIFSLVKRYSIQDSYLISALHDILQRYISSYTNLDKLADSVYENRLALSHLCYEQSMDQRSRTAQDIEAATAIIEILTNIANDLFSAMGEEAMKERLIVYQDELFRKTKRISKFRNAVNSLGKMIQEKINSINYVPNLQICHLSTINQDGSKQYDWNEKWLEGAGNGTVRGIVMNRGGAPACRVVLSITVNSETRGIYTIDKIAPGRKIPFAVSYHRTDILEDRVTWAASAVYYDEHNAQSRTSSGHGVISVEVTDEEWGISHVGREKFNTQFAAEGEEFCGRTNELLKLNNLYNANILPNRYPSLLVMGLRRAGKSSVIKYFKESLRLRDSLAPLFIDAQGIAGDIANAFFNLVFNELYRCYRKEMEGFVDFKKKWEEISRTPDWVGQLPTYFMELSELLGGRKVIFILDEMENVFYANRFQRAQSEEQFFGMIRALIQNYQSYVSFIFCGSDKLLTSCLEQKRESQMFQVLQKIYVGRMSINDIRDMFEKYNSVYDIKFKDEAIDAIMYYTNGLIWYTKVIAYNILDRIIDQEHIVREEVHASDVNCIVELLINGDLGAELIDLLDNNFGARRKAIIRAMARAAKNPNDSVSIDMISAELVRLNYVDNETGEVLGIMSEEDICNHLSILEKMDFIEKDSHREKSFRFTTELYRLLMLSDRRIDKFIATTGGEKHAR